MRRNEVEGGIEEEAAVDSKREGDGAGSLKSARKLAEGITIPSQ